nr:nucleotidyltransferase family protein [Sphingomonas brevis]
MARCCHWNFATVDERSRPDVHEAIDWNLVVALARRHRVQGLVWNAVGHFSDRLPVEARNALSSDARLIAVTNLAIAAECRELQQLFDQSNVPLLFVKGLTVGALAYRAPMLKMAWDIDLLTDPADLASAARLLLDRGFSVREPSDIKHLKAWHRMRKDSLWSRHNELYVELHPRLADNARLIPTIDVHSPRQQVEIAPAQSLSTLAQEELFAYLTVHGASSAWFRLKWIADFAGWLSSKSGDEIQQLYHRSQELGAGRAAGQALLLADKLFDTLAAAPSLKRSLGSDQMTRKLSSVALRMLTKELRDPTDLPFGTWAIHWTQLLLKPDLGFKVSEMWRQARSIFGPK